MPGFFFYHSVLGLGYISAFLGGFFGPVSVLIFPVLFFLIVRKIHSGYIRLRAIDVAFLLLICFNIFIALINYSVRMGNGIEREVFYWALSGVLFNLTLYIIARTINLESKKLIQGLSMSLILMCATAVSNIGKSGFFYLAQDGLTPELVATYQGFGRSIVGVAIFSISFAKSKLSFYSVALIAALGLFVNGARSELIGFLFALSVFSFFKFRIRASAFILMALAVGMTLVILFLPRELVEDSRFAEISHISESSSFLARVDLSDFALSTIYDNPLFGDYGSYAYSMDLGDFAHNLLSAWVNLGLVGFLGYIYLFILMGIRIKSFKFPSENFGLYNLSIGFFAYTIFVMILAKDYSYMFFGLTAGFLARLSDSSIRD